MAIKGKIVVTNGIEAHRIWPEELETYLLKGWHRGFTDKQKENTSKNSKSRDSSIVYKLIDDLDMQLFKEYYKFHTASDTAKYFNIENKYIYRILDYLNIPKHSQAESTYLKFKEHPEYQEKLHKKHKPFTEEQKKLFKGRIPHNKGKNKNNYEPCRKSSEKLKGRHANKAWNKGLTKETDERVAIYAENLKGHESFIKDKEEFLAKQYNSKKINNTFNTSSPEEKYYEKLKLIYGDLNVIRQYNKDPGYPFACDFYIPSEDLFIELNFHWTHGGRPFDKNDEECQKQLAVWQEKAKTSNYYKSAINTWTLKDPLKVRTAIKNNLNYDVLYN